MRGPTMSGDGVTFAEVFTVMFASPGALLRPPSESASYPLVVPVLREMPNTDEIDMGDAHLVACRSSFGSDRVVYELPPGCEGWAPYGWAGDWRRDPADGRSVLSFIAPSPPHPGFVGTITDSPVVSPAALGSPGSDGFDFSALADQVAPWHAEKFPGVSLDRVGLKFAEEAGEVAGALVKIEEGRLTLDDLAGEIGDATICLARICTMAGLDYSTVVAERWAEVRERPVVIHLGPEAQCLCGHHVNRHNGGTVGPGGVTVESGLCVACLCRSFHPMPSGQP